MLRIAYEDGKLQSVPVIRLQTEPSARKGLLSPEKVAELLGALPTHLRPLIISLYWCGVRLGEAQAIEWTQVDLQARLIRLHEDQTKDSEARKRAASCCSCYAFAGHEAESWSHTNLRTEWAKACTAVGLGRTIKQKSKSGNLWFQYSRLIVHDLRRSAIRNLINAGGPEKSMPWQYPAIRQAARV
jgi:integrase